MKESDLDLRRLLNLLRSRLRAIVCTVGLFLIGALLVILFVRPLYSSLMVVEVAQVPPNILNIQEVNPEEYRAPEVLKTIEQALGSRTLMLRVIHTLKLDQDEDFAPKSDGPWTEYGLSQKMADRVRVALRRGSRLIEVEAADHDPERARIMAETVIQEFTKEQIEQRIGVWKETNVVLLREADELKEKLQKSEQALQDFKEQHQAVSLEETQNIVVEKLRDLNFKLTSAKAERLRLEGDLAAIDAHDPANLEALLSIPSVAAMPAVQALNKQISDQIAERATLKEQYLAQNTRLISSQAQLGELKKSRAEMLANAGLALRQAYASARANETKLETELREQEQRALELNRLEIPVSAFRREIESNRALYDALLKRLKETDITQNFDKNYLRVVEAPLVAEKPSFPKKWLVLALALFGGTFVGIGLVISRELLGASSRGEAEAKEPAPSHPFTDSVALLAHAEAACLVARAEGTSRSAATRAAALIATAKSELLGVALNGAPETHASNLVN